MINKNETLKLVAIGTTMSFLIIANTNSSFIFSGDQMMQVIEKQNKEYSTFFNNQQCLSLGKDFSSITLSNPCFVEKNEKEEINFFHEYKKIRVKMHIRKKFNYVPYFDFDEISEEL